MRKPTLRIDLHSAGFKDDPVPTWHDLQARGDVVFTRLPLLGRVALATRRPIARRVLEDEETFTLDARRAGQRSAAGTRWWVPRDFRRLADNLLAHEGPQHHHLRQRVERPFRRIALDALQPRIEALARERLDALATSGAPDFVRDVARPLPMAVMGELLGIDSGRGAPGTPLGLALERLTRISGPRDLFLALPALRTITREMSGELDDRRHAPREDLLSALVATDDDAGARNGSPPLDDDKSLAMIFLLYVAGHETTTHLLSAAVLELLRRPAMKASLPRPVDARAVGELMRYLGPVQFAKPRFVTRRIVIGDTTLERGDTIAPLVAAANMDADVFDSPGTPDFSRSPVRHLGFGGGAHTCLGLQLAIRETATVLEEFLQRFPDASLPDAKALPDWNRRLGLRALDSLRLDPGSLA